MGAIIIWGAVRICRESADSRLEAVRRHIQVDKVIKTLKNVPGVDEVHDIHIWTITSGILALSVHLLIEDQMVSRSAEIVDTVNKDLGQQFNIRHTTLQLECEKCESCPSGIICNVGHLEDQS